MFVCGEVRWAGGATAVSRLIVLHLRVCEWSVGGTCGQLRALAVTEAFMV